MRYRKERALIEYTALPGVLMAGKVDEDVVPAAIGAASLRTAMYITRASSGLIV
jgi:hypothetical protein